MGMSESQNIIIYQLDIITPYSTCRWNKYIGIKLELKRQDDVSLLYFHE